MLRELVTTFGEGDWQLIADKLPGRNQRQVRERWLNYLSPEVNMGPFTVEEDNLIQEKHEEIGPRWVKMTHYFKGRTDIALKNRWMIIQRRKKLGLPLYESGLETDTPVTYQIRAMSQKSQSTPTHSYVSTPRVKEVQSYNEYIFPQNVQPEQPEPQAQTMKSKVNEFFKVKAEDSIDFWNEVFGTSTTEMEFGWY